MFKGCPEGRTGGVRRQKLLEGINPDYWIAKVERNMQRDQSSTESLINEGWTVLRFWESEIIGDVDQIVAVIAQAVGSVRLSVAPSAS